MDRSMILRNTVIPKYHQLEELLRDKIAGLLPDDPIPSEAQICADFKVSRITARKAVDDLAREGLLYREQGRGTYVARPKVDQRFVQKTLGFYEDMVSRGAEVQTWVLEQKTVPATQVLATQLGIRKGELLVKLVRVSSVDNVRILIATSFLPHALFPGLEGEDLTRGSLYQLLQEKYGIRIVHGARTIEAEPPGSLEIEQLGINPQIPLLVVSGTMFDEHGRAVEYAETKHRSDRSRVEIQVDQLYPT
jgi:GntR family transcriptional regulator